MTEAKLLPADEIKAIESFYDGFVGTGVVRVDCEQIRRLIAHIAAQAACITSLRSELERLSGDVQWIHGRDKYCNPSPV